MREIIAELPGHFRNYPIPEDIIGATILGFGHVDGNDDEQLVIDYTPKGSSEAKRVAFRFSDTGMVIDD